MTIEPRHEQPGCPFGDDGPTDSISTAKLETL
jgi:hypothetical protein